MIRSVDPCQRRRIAVFAAALAVAATAIASATFGAEGRRAEPPASIELQPAQRSELDAIEIEVADPRHTRPPRRPVSDLLVELLPGRTPLGRALDRPGGVGIATERRLFRARLTVVSGGRLLRGPTAWCGGFDAGVSACDVDCDGGRFNLRLNVTGEARFTLVVGPGADEEGRIAASGISLSACSLDGADDLRLVARRGASADIALSDDRPSEH